MCFLLCFNKCSLYTQGQTASVSAKPCGLNFHRLGLPLIFICAYPRPQRVRFTDCGAKVFPVLGSATSTEVLQPLQSRGRSRVPTCCYMVKDYRHKSNIQHFSFVLKCFTYTQPPVAHCCNLVTGATESDLIGIISLFKA